MNLSKNIWYDFGEAKGGNVIDFVCAYLGIQNEDHTVVDALRWLRNIQPFAHHQVCSKEEVVNYGATLELRKAAALQNSALIDYLSSRGIPQSYAKKYLKEVHVRNANTGKIFYAIGLLNENGGFELRNKFFKGCIARKKFLLSEAENHCRKKYTSSKASWIFFLRLPFKKIDLKEM